jgi:hypothetical protein
MEFEVTAGRIKFVITLVVVATFGSGLGVGYLLFAN